MNRDYLILFPVAAILFLVQIFMLDSVAVADKYIPYLYILLLYYYPYGMRLSLQLMISFLFGLLIDFMQDTGGSHALAMLTASYVRPFFLRITYGESYALNTVRLIKTPIKSLLLFSVMLIAVHHIVLYSMILFDLQLWDQILLGTLYNLLLTTAITVCTILFFYKRAKTTYQI